MTPDQLAEIRRRDDRVDSGDMTLGDVDRRKLLAEVDRLWTEVEQLQEDSAKLNALEVAGVDNWDGYSYAMEILDEGEAAC